MGLERVGGPDALEVDGLDLVLDHAGDLGRAYPPQPPHRKAQHPVHHLEAQSAQHPLAGPQPEAESDADHDAEQHPQLADAAGAALGQLGQRGFDIGVQNVSRCAVLNRRQYQRDDALGDCGVAVGQEVERAVLGSGRVDPDRCGAAADQGGIGLQCIRHRLERAAQIDQQAVAIVGIKEIIFAVNIGEGGGGGVIGCSGGGGRCGGHLRPCNAILPTCLIGAVRSQQGT